MITTRIFSFGCIVGLSALLTVAAGTVAESHAATLQSNIVVRGDTVALGDIFQDAGKHADRVILQAPEPGRKLILNATWLYRAARAYGIEWRPLSILDQAIVERASHLISAEQIRDVLAVGVRGELTADGKFEIDLDNRLLQMYLPGEILPDVKLQTLQLDRQSQRFSAIVVGAESTSRPVRVTATGRYYRLVEVPVLVRRLHGSEIIDATDLRVMTLRADRVDMDAIRERDDLVGMSPLRTLSAGRPVRQGEIRQPIMVAKGSIVSMTYMTDRMVLTAQGKAMQDGSKGDTVRIQNAKTHKMIDGVVTGYGRVTVAPAGNVALN